VNVCCVNVCDNVADEGDTDPAPDGDTLVFIVNIGEGGGGVVVPQHLDTVSYNDCSLDCKSDTVLESDCTIAGKLLKEDSVDCIELICDCNVDIAEVFCCVCDASEDICDADGKEDSIDCIWLICVFNVCMSAVFC
jgi:hypothetical protein